MGLFIAYNTDAIVARSSKHSTRSRTSAKQIIETSGKTSKTNMRQGVHATAASAVKPSDVFKAAKKQKKRFVASNSSSWATLEETIINVILPGAIPPATPKSPTPSKVLGWMAPCRRSLGLQPSHVICSCELLQKRQSRLIKIAPKQVVAPANQTRVPLETVGRFASLLVNIASHGKVVTPMKKDLDFLEKIGFFASLLLDIASQGKVKVVMNKKTVTKPKNITKSKVIAPVKKAVPTQDNEVALVHDALKPAEKEQPLRVLLLRSCAFRSGLELPMPTRPIPVPVPQVVVEVADDSDSDFDSDDEEECLRGVE
jgi:hypothetical protein